MALPFSAIAFCTSSSAFGSASGVHRRVDVRTKHQGLAPIRHGEGRIEPRGFGKSARRFGVIEPVGQVQSLVHEQLRALDFGAHGEGVHAEVLQPRRQRRAGRRRRGVGCGSS